jgi:hypothetical protein
MAPAREENHRLWQTPEELSFTRVPQPLAGFPLTPALSPREREKSPPSFEKARMHASPGRGRSSSLSPGERAGACPAIVPPRARRRRMRGNRLMGDLWARNSRYVPFGVCQYQSDLSDTR